jgi:hypothetical protein
MELQSLNSNLCEYKCAKEKTYADIKPHTCVFDFQGILVSCLVQLAVSEYGCFSHVCCIDGPSHKFW